MTIIGEAINKIQEKLKSLNVSRYADVQDYYKSLNTENEREDFIQAYEIFWFTFTTLLNIVDNLGFLIKKIEALRPESIVPQKIVDHASMRELLCDWKLIFNEVYTLISLLKDARVITENEVKVYRELSYIYLLRNDFVQHPTFDYPFESFGLSFFYKHDNKFLPHVIFGPASGGLTFYLDHHKQKSGVSVDREWAEVLAENKAIFIASGGWKNLINQSQEARFKGWGLPEINQEQFAKDLSDLFERYVFPYLVRVIEDAKQDRVIR